MRTSLQRRTEYQLLLPPIFLASGLNKKRQVSSNVQGIERLMNEDIYEITEIVEGVSNGFAGFGYHQVRRVDEDGSACGVFLDLERLKGAR